MANDVFISYSRRDLEFVTQLHQYLTAQGISAWFDQSSLEPGTEWRESIVQGIMDCKVFLVVVSPDSAASINVRKEIDLAESHQKQILPLMWRETKYPPSIEYQLTGIQYLHLKETASEENLNALANILKKIVGGTPLAEASTQEPGIQVSTITAKAASPRPDTENRSRRRRGRGTAQEVSAIGTGVSVMTKVVTRVEAFTSEEQDAINQELTWLFQAADHFLKVQRGEAERTTPAPVPIPPEAETDNKANNLILDSVDDFAAQMIDSQIQSIIKQINIYVRNLAFELDKEAQLGGAVAANIALRNSINSQQKAVAERTQELSKLMQQVYGVLVYGPDDLVQQFS